MGAAEAQVMEIGPAGEVALYQGPHVFTAEGAQPIVETPSPSPAASTPARAERAAVDAALAAAATDYALSPALVEAVAWRESRFRHDAISPKGAVGVMQLMPGTAQRLGVDRYDLGQNVRGGTAYLSRMLTEFGGDLTLALAAYNAGPGAVRRYGGVPPYAETQAYVSAILGRLAAAALDGRP